MLPENGSRPGELHLTRGGTGGRTFYREPTLPLPVSQNYRHAISTMALINLLRVLSLSLSLSDIYPVEIITPLAAHRESLLLAQKPRERARQWHAE